MSHSPSNFERQEKILQLLGGSQRLSLEEVCTTFSISAATARRDLEALALQGKLKRVHGGAISIQHTPPEPPILQRRREQSAEKQRIGHAAAAIVQDGETVFLGSGTTVLEVARQLLERKNLTVITNSLPVVEALQGAPGMTVICLGGMLRGSELSLIGHLTEQALGEVRADKVFIGIRAISVEHGLTNEYLPETMTDRAILKAGRQIVVLADHTKCGRSATVLVAPLESIHTLITDEAAPEEFARQVQRRGVQLIRV